MKSPDFATSQDEATNGVRITRPAFKPVPKMDRAEFILVSSVDAVVAHRDEANLIGRPREKSADGRLCRGQRGRVKPFGLGCYLDDALRTRTRPLDDSLAPKIDSRDFEWRVSESKPCGARPQTSPMQIWPIPASRRARGSSTVQTITIFDAPFARATAAVVKARNTSMTATEPVASVAPSRRL